MGKRGVRCEKLEHQAETADERDPSLAQIMGVLFNVMFLDHLATDIEHLERLNQRFSNRYITQPEIEGYEKMRPLTSLLMTPTVDLAQLAEQHQKDLPYLIRYFLTSLGRDAASCADLMSYLLFASKYTRALIEIGYDDASKRIDEIESFLYSSDNGTTTFRPAQSKQVSRDRQARWPNGPRTVLRTPRARPSRSR
jgi:hypothetical protein